MRIHRVAASLTLRQGLHSRLRSGVGRHEHLDVDTHELGEHLYEDGRLESLVAPGKVTASHAEEVEEEPYE
jgi:hypothetical protein